MSARQILLLADAGFALIVAAAAYAVTDRPAAAIFVLAVTAFLARWYWNARVPVMTFVSIVTTGVLAVGLFTFIKSMRF